MSTPYNPGGMRRFRLSVATSGWTMQKFTKTRDGETTHGEERVFFGDCIAQGCIFTKGFTVLRFIGEDPQTETFETFEAFQEKYPESDGSYWINWQDKCCFFCGSDIDHNYGPSFCDQCGVSWDTPVDWPNPSLGKWTHAMTIEPGDQPKNQ